jgi:hypothetical protein
MTSAEHLRTVHALNARVQAHPAATPVSARQRAPVSAAGPSGCLLDGGLVAVAVAERRSV